jgi:membrane protease YdiL (CAAX protease family)
MTRSSSTAEPFHRIVTTVALAVGAMFIVGAGARELFALLNLPPSPPLLTLNLPVWALALAMVTVLPAIEETVFRGWLISWLRAPLGFWAAALVANSAWVAIRLPNSINTAATYFALGLILSIVRWRTESVPACIAAHAAYNLVPAAFMLVYLM